MAQRWSEKLDARSSGSPARRIPVSSLRASRGFALAVVGWVGLGGAVGAARGAPGELVFTVSCGSPVEVRVADGTIFGPDSLYADGPYGAVGGDTMAVETEQLAFLHADRDIRDLRLFADERVGASGYIFDVPEGEYEVTLHFAGFVRSGIGTGELTILVEGDTLAVDFDLTREAGLARALELRSWTSVHDGDLVIEFFDSRGDHDLAAISIREADLFDETSPAPPREVSALDTYGGVLVRWERSLEPDFAEYRLLRSNGSSWETWGTRRVPFAVVPVDGPVAFAVQAIDIYGNASDTVFTEAAGPRTLADSVLPGWELELAPEDWALLNGDVFSDTTVQGLLSVDGDFVGSADVRYRGNSSRDAPKKSWNIDFRDDFALDGADRLILKATFVDPSVQREILLADLLEAGGVPAQQSSPIRLFVNGRYLGVHVRVERLDEHFLARIDQSGDLFRSRSNFEPQADLKGYISKFDVSSGADHWERREIIEMLEGMTRVSEADLLHWLDQRVDLKQVVDLFCHYVIAANREWVDGDHYLFHSDQDSLFRIYPWDLFESFREEDIKRPILTGTKDYPVGKGNYHRLFDQVLSHPSLMRTFTERLRYWMDRHLSADGISQAMKTRRHTMAEDLTRDVEKFSRESSGPVGREQGVLEKFFLEREVEILAQLKLIEPPQVAHLQISELGVEDGGVRSIEVKNLSLYHQDLRDLYLSDDPDQPFMHWQPSTVVLPRGRVTLVLPTPVLPGEWIGLYQRDNGAVLADSLRVPDTLHPDRSWGLYPEMSRRWKLLDGVSLGEENRWTNPAELSLDFEAQVVGTQAMVHYQIRVLNHGADPLLGEVMLDVRNIDGIYIFPLPVRSYSVELAPGDSLVVNHSARIPKNAMGPGGYRIQTRLMLPGDDEWGRASRELFVVGRPPEEVSINEFMALNDSTISDAAGEYDDWIEIHNSGVDPISLDGFYLTDDLAEDPFQWACPDVWIFGDEKQLFWCDDAPQQGIYHTNFRLSEDGEEIALVRRGIGGLPEVVDWVVFGRQAPDVSLGRYPDGRTTLLTLDSATPGRANDYRPR